MVLCEFEANVVYIVSSRPARATKWDPVWKNQNPRPQTQTQPNKKEKMSLACRCVVVTLSAKEAEAEGSPSPWITAPKPNHKMSTDRWKRERYYLWGHIYSSGETWSINFWFGNGIHVFVLFKISFKSPMIINIKSLPSSVELMHSFELPELGWENSVHNFFQPKASVPANRNTLFWEAA